MLIRAEKEGLGEREMTLDCAGAILLPKPLPALWPLPSPLLWPLPLLSLRPFPFAVFSPLRLGSTAALGDMVEKASHPTSRRRPRTAPPCRPSSVVLSAAPPAVNRLTTRYTSALAQLATA